MKKGFMGRAGQASKAVLKMREQRKETDLDFYSR